MYTHAHAHIHQQVQKYTLLPSCWFALATTTLTFPTHSIALPMIVDQREQRAQTENGLAVVAL